MKVRITDIGPRGLEFTEKLNLEDLNERMNAAEGNEIIFTEAPTVRIKVTKIYDGGEAKGNIAASYIIPCGRCLDKLPRKVSVDFSFLLKPHNKELKKDEIDDVGIIYYNGEHVEFKTVLEDTLILGISPFDLPEISKNKKCIECKRDFQNSNITSKSENKTLAQAFKKAGIS